MFQQILLVGKNFWIGVIVGGLGYIISGFLKQLLGPEKIFRLWEFGYIAGLLFGTLLVALVIRTIK